MSKTFYEVFRPGEYPQGVFDAAFCQAVADGYNPALCEAPITVDHAETGPAAGWVDAVVFEGGLLKTSFGQVSDNFKKAVDDGLYKKVSVEFMTKFGESGKPYLRAVSFLGVATPAVLGLKPIKFAQHESTVERFTMELGRSANEPAQAAGSEVAASAATEEPPQTTRTDVVDFAMVMDPQILRAEIAKLNAANQSLTEKFSASDAERKTAQENLGKLGLETQRNRFEAFVNEQIAWGNVNDEMKAKCYELLEALSGVAKFSRDPKDNLVEKFMSFVKSIPKFAPTGELATKANAGDADQVEDDARFANADPARLALHKAAKAHAAQFKTSYEEAVTFIRNQNHGRA